MKDTVKRLVHGLITCCFVFGLLPPLPVWGTAIHPVAGENQTAWFTPWDSLLAEEPAGLSRSTAAEDPLARLASLAAVTATLPLTPTATTTVPPKPASTATPTASATVRSKTPTSTATPSTTPTATSTPSATPTSTSTANVTPTATISPTLTPTPLPTVTLFPTSTLELGPEGGAFASDDGQIGVAFPAGAVKLRTKLRLERGALPKAGEASRVASPFRLTAVTAVGGFPVFSFDQPLTITVRYSAADEARLTQKLGAGSRLDLFYYDPAAGNWVILPGTTDRASRTITAFTDHFTDYGILATYCPKPPNVLANGCFQSDVSGWQLTNGSGGIAITHNISDGLPAGSVKMPGYVDENIKQTIANTAITTTGLFTFGFNVSTTSSSEQLSLKLLYGSDTYAQVSTSGETGWVTKTTTVALNSTDGRWYDIQAQTLSNQHSPMHLDNVVLAYDRPIPHFDSGLLINGGFEGNHDSWTRQGGIYNAQEGVIPGGYYLPGSTGNYLYQTVSITRTGYYTVSVAAKSVTTSETLRLGAFSDNGATAVAYGDFGTTTDWTTRTITIGLSGGTYEFGVKTQAGSGVPIYLDNVALIYAGPYFNGGRLNNGGLENNAAGWETVGAGGHAAPSYDSGAGRPAGSLSLGGWRGEYVSQTFTVTVPGRYQAGLDLYAAASGPGVRVDILDQTGNLVAGFDAPINIGAAWGRQAQPVDLSAGTYRFRATTIADGASFWLDNLGISYGGNVLVGGYLDYFDRGKGVAAALTGSSNWEKTHQGSLAGYIRQITRSASGNFFAVTSGGYLYRSPDALNWEAIWVGSGGTGQIVQIAAAKNGVLYASMATDAFNSGKAGVYRSSNDGLTWSQIFQTPDGGWGYRWIGRGVTISPVNDNVLWFVGDRTYAGGTERAWVSTNAGASWTSVREVGNVGMDIVVPDPADAATGYAVQNGAIYKTSNYGASWTQIATFGGGSTAPRGFELLTIDPLNPRTIWATAGANGLYRTTDGGTTWTRTPSPFNGTYQAVSSVSRAADGVLYIGGDAVGGASRSIYSSVDDGETWQNITYDLTTDPLLYDGYGPLRVLSIYPLGDDFALGHNLGGCPWGGQCGKGVNPATGNFSYGASDLSLPGTGLGLSLGRTYNSQDPQRTPFGYGWSSPYAMSVVSATDGSLTVANEDGKRDRYTLANGGYVAEAGTNASIVKGAGGDYTLTRPDQTVFHFNATGRLTSVADRNGNTQSLGYSGGQATVITDTVGRTVNLAYNAQGLVASLTDPAGRSVGYAYDSLGNLTTVTNTLGHPTTYRYVAGTHLLDRVTDANGQPAVTNTYGPRGRVLGQTDAAGNGQNLQYNPVTGRTVFTDTLGFSSVVTSDVAYRVTALQDPLGTVITNTYNLNNDRIAQKDGRGNLTRYEYGPLGLVTAITDTLGGTSRFFYDANHNVTQTVDALGRVAAFSYDDQGNLTAATTYLTDTLPSTPVVSSFGYDGKGRLQRSTDAENRTTSFGDDGQGNLTALTDTLGHVTTFGYDAIGRRASTTEANGHRTDYAFDAASRPTFITETLAAGQQLVTSYEYDAAGNLKKSVDPEGLETQYTYDSRNQLIEEKQVKGGDEQRKTGYGYNQLGQRTVITDALGSVTRFAFDGAGRVVTTTDALNGVTVAGYDRNNNLVSLRDARGNTTSYEYDALNRQTAVYEPLGRTTRSTYDAVGNRTSATNALGDTTRYFYDALNRPITVTDPLTGTTVSRYDKVGNLTRLIDASGGATDYGYDAANRLTTLNDPLAHNTRYGYDVVGNRTAITDAKGITTTTAYDYLRRPVAASDGLGNTTRYEYDGIGNRTVVTDANGNATHFGYDALYRLSSVLDAAGNSTTYEYDKLGNLKEATDANSHVTRYDYDALSRPLTITNPLTQTTSFGYDANGNRTAVRDANGTTVSYEYDALNQLTKVIYPDTQVQYAYTLLGQRQAMTDTLGTTAYNYDPLGRMAAVTFPGNLTVGYGYDGQGNRTRLVYPDGKVVTSTYDLAGRLANVTDWASRVVTYSYDIGNRLTNVQLPNQTAADYRYDLANRLATVTNTSTLSGTLSAFQYGLDQVGNRLAVTETAGTTLYAYDPLYRLTGVTFPDLTTQAYAYDPVGNRLVFTDTNGLTTTYSYDGGDRLSMAGTNAYTWDNNGNLLSETGPITTTYAYDFANRLKTVTGTVVSAYAYNGDGLRMQKTDNGTTTNFVWDVNASLPVIITDSNSLYLYGLSLVAMQQGTNPAYYHQDGLGSIRNLTDESGRLSVSYDYDPFGQLTYASASNPNPFRYTGQYFDNYTNIYYLRARYYQPGTGRFLTEDPFPGRLYDPRTLNAYVYVVNNPLLLVDPTGRDWDDLESWWWWSKGLSDGVQDAATLNLTALVRDVSGTPRPESADYYRGRAAADNFMIVAGTISGEGGVAVAVAASPSGAGSVIGVVAAGYSAFVTAAAVRNSVEDHAILACKASGPVVGTANASKAGNNPYGRYGSPEHKARIAQRVAELKAKGHTLFAGGGGRDRAFKVNGKTRYPDIVTLDKEGNMYFENVGRTKADRLPISREQEVIDDFAAEGIELHFTAWGN